MTPFFAALSILDANLPSAAPASFIFFSVIKLSNFLANVRISDMVLRFRACLARDFLKSLKLDLFIGNLMPSLVRFFIKARLYHLKQTGSTDII